MVLSTNVQSDQTIHRPICENLLGLGDIKAAWEMGCRGIHATSLCNISSANIKSFVKLSRRILATLHSTRLHPLRTSTCCSVQRRRPASQALLNCSLIAVSRHQNAQGSHSRRFALSYEIERLTHLRLPGCLLCPLWSSNLPTNLCSKCRSQNQPKRLPFLQLRSL